MNILKRKILPRISKIKKKLESKFGAVKNKFSSSKVQGSGADLDKQLVYSLSTSKIPSLRQIKHVKKTLSLRELWVIRILFLFIVVNLVILGVNFYQNNLKRVPVVGGEYIEGVVGSPRYINPLYSQINDIDSDIGKLVFSSLYKHNKDGELIRDLVVESDVNKDNTVYTFTIRDDVKWHNGDQLTADDIVFTFNAIKNADYNSPLRSSFSGVEIKQLDDRRIEFALSKSYAPFKQLLTFGILPKDVWGQIPIQSASLAELNLKPIGSGPYKFQSLIKDKTGNIQAYNLTRNQEYYGNKPYVEELQFKFYINYIEAVDDLNKNKIDGIAHLPHHQKNELAAQGSLNFYRLNMPRISSIFLNQDDNSALEDRVVRQALAYALNKQEIANNFPSGILKPVHFPFPSMVFTHTPEVEKYEFDKQKAQNLLKEAGWERFEISEQEIKDIKEKQSNFKEQKQDGQRQEEEEDNASTQEELTDQEKTKMVLGAGEWLQKQGENENETQYLYLTLTTLENKKNEQVVDDIKKAWEDIGVRTQINVVSANEVRSEVIEPRNFEALYYTQVIDEESDYYTFWHSSQAKRSGLNIANYENEEVDGLLEEARKLSAEEERVQRYEQVQNLITQDLPAIFMFSPKYLYAQGKKIKGFDTSFIYSPNDRFSNVSNWYIKTGEKLVW